MKASSLIGVIEAEYSNMLRETYGHGRKDDITMVSYTRYVPPERITVFKEWFRHVLMLTPIGSEDLPLNVLDMLIEMASRTSFDPPHKLLHPKLVKILELFDESELYEIFGPSRVVAVTKLIERYS